MDSFTHKLICSGVQCRGSSSKSARDMQGGTELTSITGRAGGVGRGQSSSPGMEAPAGTMALLSPTSLSLRQQVSAKSELSITLAIL